MTRAEQILEYANSFNGKDMESEELKEIIRLAVIDGAKWADNHPIKPSLPSNLDEAAEEQYPDFSNSIASKAAVDSIRDAFKAGAKWQKKQMINEVVEFECIGKKIRMTIQELIDYYINSECVDVAGECGF